MKIYFDTEFVEYPRTIVPLSIGAVREDGEEYYAVFNDIQYDRRAWQMLIGQGSDRDTWLRDNVLPHLPMDVRYQSGGRYGWKGLWPCLEMRHPDVKNHKDIAEELIEFSGSSPEFWAYFADYDWVVLAQTFGRMIDLPKGWPFYCRDIKQEMDRLGFKKDDLPKQSEDEHDALADARWNKQALEYIRSEA